MRDLKTLRRDCQRTEGDVFYVTDDEYDLLADAIETHAKNCNLILWADSQGRLLFYRKGLDLL